MEIRLYNTLSRTIEQFEPVEAGCVRMYSCGPTVYNHVHIGNLRAFLCADILQRVLRIVGGYQVRWVMNITDIDDKTIRDSQPGSAAWKADVMGAQTADPHENLRRLTRYYEQVFLHDIAAIGIRREDLFAMPRATEYIPAMMELIERIWRNGYAYVAGGSVYFDLSAWIREHPYGLLFAVDLEHFVSGARIDADQYEREEVSDFVLWKARKEGEPWWDLVLGDQVLPGRPGWHIECSAMGHELLGLPFDIHTGGVDLRFPHHEDEIAQSAAGYGCSTARFWVHNEFLEVEGQKMSKSLGNFYTLADLLERGLDPLDVRYAMLGAHYQSVYNFTFDGVAAARRARRRVQEYIYQLQEQSGRRSCDVEKLRQQVFAELADNLHTPKALAALFTFIGEHPAVELEPSAQRALLEFFEQLNSIVGVWEIAPRPLVVVPERVRQLAQERWEARLQRDFARADQLRQQIAQEGFAVRDRSDGYDLVPVEE
ncbi:MAG: cysteine--tRNA ligase [Candidatus Kapaibacterium sp.]|nr:MAG: cysteine--tRNA ligase [Candidatus Kapabacteria bacterium]